MRAEIAVFVQNLSDIIFLRTAPHGFCAKSVRYNIFTNGAPYVTFVTSQLLVAVASIVQ